MVFSKKWKPVSSSGATKETEKTRQKVTSQKRKPFSPKAVCLVLTLILLIGLLLGFVLSNALVVFALLLPTGLYQVYRTAGPFTKFSSIALVICLVAVMVLVILNVQFDVAQYLGFSHQYVGRYAIPLGDIKTVLPLLIVIFAIILLIRTAGVYTKWLSVNIIIGAFTALYILSPEQFPEMVRWGVKQVMRLIWYIF